MSDRTANAERIAELEKTTLSLRTDAAYWKGQHDHARRREEALKSELTDTKARVRYLEGRLYGRQTERSKSGSEKSGEEHGQKRRRGGQPGSRGAPRRNYEELEVREETRDIAEKEKHCPICGLPRKQLSEADHAERIEIEVKAHRRVIHRLKYVPGCRCEPERGIITAEAVANLIPQSRYGISVWAHILLQKYHFQIPVARVLKAMSLVGLPMPGGTVGDGLKRLAPLFEPVYAALEEKSREAAWWAADETRWSVFETTKTKTSFRWYLWVFLSEHSVVHVLDPSRATRVIEEHLGTVSDGILLVDRYSAYKSFAKDRAGITLAFCWSHVRRDFLDAGKSYEELFGWAEQWVARINELFHRNGRRRKLRAGSTAFTREDALLRESVKQMREQAESELKEKNLHHRRRYVLKSLLVHWDGLVVFVEHPEIPMDNNASERALRTAVVGRKNYYGSGAIWSARFTAVMFSIFETLEHHRINQQQWLTDYLTACAQAGGLTPPREIEPHLPWNIAGAEKAGRRYSGRVFSAEELAMVSDLVEHNTSDSRTELARRACRLLRWYTPTGSLKESGMGNALLKMEGEGKFVLPPSRGHKRGPNKPIPHTARTAPREDTFMPAGRIPDLRLELAQDKQRRSLWNEYIDRYHYLGYSPPAGAYLRYFAYSGERELALFGFSSAAWKIAPRDAYIGWSARQREDHLSLVVNNSRFLILPWVISRNLASKLLSMAAARLPEDWQRRWGYRPVLLETFVETDRFTGASYKAANWRHVGTTAGRGRNDPQKLAALPPKEIFLYPLTPNFRRSLQTNAS
jgi:transposase